MIVAGDSNKFVSYAGSRNKIDIYLCHYKYFVSGLYLSKANAVLLYRKNTYPGLDYSKENIDPVLKRKIKREVKSLGGYKFFDPKTQSYKILGDRMGLR